MKKIIILVTVFTLSMGVFVRAENTEGAPPSSAAQPKE